MRKGSFVALFPHPVKHESKTPKDRMPDDSIPKQSDHSGKSLIASLLNPLPTTDSRAQSVPNIASISLSRSSEALSSQRSCDTLGPASIPPKKSDHGSTQKQVSSQISHNISAQKEEGMIICEKPSVLTYLREVRLRRSLIKSDEPFYIFARLGKSENLSPLLITENEHVTTSLVSENLANALLRQGNAQNAERQDKSGDRWIQVDLSWPYDAGERRNRPGGLPLCFKTAQISFLVVSRDDMKDGIVLGKDELNRLDLQFRWIDYRDGGSRRYLALNGSLVSGAISLMKLRQCELSVHESRPFQRLCSLAESASTRRNSPYRIEQFRAVRKLEDEQDQFEK